MTESATVGSGGSNGGAGVQRRKAMTGWRTWVLRMLLAAGSPLLVLAVLELSLRAAGYGWPAGFFRRMPTGAVGVNHQFTRNFAGSSTALRAQPVVMSARKRPGAYRIFILGESAAQGVPDASYSFGRMLEVMLRHGRPAVDAEVVNTGVTAINSHIVRLIARDCARYEPDLFIIYMGNNEVTGPWGPGTIFRPFSGNLSLIRASLWARSLRTGQLIGALLRGGLAGQPPAEWRGMEAFAGNVVPHHDPRRRTVHEHFRANLRDIIAICRRAGADVIVCTVAVNLRDCPPFASAHRPDLAGDARARWQALYERGIAAESAGRPGEALEIYRQAAAIDDERADLLFRMARCHLALGQAPEARRLYEKARDCDALQFRTDSAINRSIRETVRACGDSRVVLADVEEALSRPPHCAQGIPGRESFWEHVHMNFAGNHVIACELLPLVRALAGRKGNAGPATAPAVPDIDECARLLAYTAFDRQRVAASMLEMISRPPFTAQMDHESACRTLAEMVRALAPSPQEMTQAAATYRGAIALRRDDWRLRANFAALSLAMGDAGTAAAEMAQVMKMLPDDPGIRLAAACTALAAGDIDRAERLYRQIMSDDSACAEAHKGLGDTLMARGKIAESMESYRRALALKPGYREAHANLGEALRAAGDTEGAMRELRKALEMLPDGVAHGALAGVLLRQGKLAEALEHYRQAVALTPYSAAARNNLAAVLMETGYVNEAVEHLRAALEADPNYGKAHGTLGQALWRKGDYAGAARHLRKSMELGNSPPIVQSTLAMVLATAPDAALRNAQEAVALAEEACRITAGQRAFDLEALAAAYAEAGRFDEAVKIAQNARERAISAGSRRQGDRISRQIEAYAARRPWRAE